VPRAILSVPASTSSRCSMQPFQGPETAGVFGNKVEHSNHSSTSPTAGVVIAQLPEDAASEVTTLKYPPWTWVRAMSPRYSRVRIPLN